MNPQPAEKFYHSAPSGSMPFLVNIRLHARDAWAFPYSHLSHIAFNASGRLEILFASRAVIIEGRHLQELYDGLLAGEVQWVREGDQKFEREVPQEKLFISKIEVVTVEEYETKN